MSESEFSGMWPGNVSSAREYTAEDIAEYYKDAETIKQSVKARMLDCDAFDGHFGWLYFVDTSRTAERNYNGKDFLITFTETQEETGATTNLRIVTNQEFILQNGKTAYLSEDITIDEDGDAQLFVDWVFFDEDGERMPSLDPEVDTWAPFFEFDTETSHMQTENLMAMTPIVDLADLTAEGFTSATTLIPFGIYTNPSDRQDALAWALRILEETQSATLQFRSSTLLDGGETDV